MTHSLFTVDGDLYVWGWNESGQLGIPNGRDSVVSSLVSLSRKEIDCQDETSTKRQRTDSGAGKACSSKVCRNLITLDTVF